MRPIEARKSAVRYRGCPRDRTACKSLVDILAWNEGVACSIHATLTVTRGSKLNPAGCDPASDGSITRASPKNSTLSPAARELSGRRSAFDSRREHHCFVMRLVSQFLCLRNETSSILVRGAADFSRGWMRKAADLPCKQVVSERYRASPPASRESTCFGGVSSDGHLRSWPNG